MMSGSGKPAMAATRARPFKRRKMSMMMSAVGSSTRREHILSEASERDTGANCLYRVGAYAVYVRLRAVSKSLRSLLPERPSDHQQQLLPRQHPWLVLRSIDNECVNKNHNYRLCHGFFCFSEKKIHRLLDSITIGNGLYLTGSSHGWLIIVGERNLSVSLLNPITGHQIRLPPLTSFPDYIGEVRAPNTTVKHRILYGRRELIELTTKTNVSLFYEKVILTSNPT